MDYLPIPTIAEARDYNVFEDLTQLQKMNEIFTHDEDFNALIFKIILQRTNKQRRDIGKYYKHSEGKELTTDLKNHFGKEYNDFIDALFRPTSSYLASEVYKALNSGDERELVLVEILFPRTHEEIKSLADIYETLYGSELIEDLVTDIPGHFRKVFIRILKDGPRDRNEHTNIHKALEDAAKLADTSLISEPEHEKFFIELIAKSSYAYLHLIMTEYERLTGVSIPQKVKMESTEIVYEGMMMIWKCIESSLGFHAFRLRKSIALDGTKDNNLIRIIVTRSEIDLENIKSEYLKRYGATLMHDILTGTVCEYKVGLCHLLGSKI